MLKKEIVYLLIPTSNHNTLKVLNFCSCIVYLLIPTSNHNYVKIILPNNALYIF